jgi:hypothetical protein
MRQSNFVIMKEGGGDADLRRLLSVKEGGGDVDSRRFLPLGGWTMQEEATVRYALLIYSAPGAREEAGTVPKGVIGDWVEYTRAVKDAGALLGAERLTATDTATSVRVRGDDRLLTDGPFMETKEHLLGFYLVDVPDLDTALDWAARMPAAAHGTVEVRAVYTGQPWQAVM